MLYIFGFLHQTTTASVSPRAKMCCISLVSYIKPQLLVGTVSSPEGCISLVSYIKPQLHRVVVCVGLVVYLWFPTSNHNLEFTRFTVYALYIFGFLHQTTTICPLLLNFGSCISLVSYIKPQQSNVTPRASASCISLVSYIKPQHSDDNACTQYCCISLVSYIKPQRLIYCICFLLRCISLVSYIKPQLVAEQFAHKVCCISLVSYIKPQPSASTPSAGSVVYLWFPTSNHN